jgi:hypothetical protein
MYLAVGYPSLTKPEECFLATAEMKEDNFQTTEYITSVPW